MILVEKNCSIFLQNLTKRYFAEILLRLKKKNLILIQIGVWNIIFYVKGKEKSGRKQKKKFQVGAIRWEPECLELNVFIEQKNKLNKCVKKL